MTESTTDYTDSTDESWRGIAAAGPDGNQRGGCAEMNSALCILHSAFL